MKPSLNELIEEQGKKFDEKFVGYLIMTDGAEELYKPREAIKHFFKSALKEIALQSIEACEVEEKQKAHLFEPGYAYCKYCRLVQRGTYTIRKPIQMDEKSGGSIVEATDVSFDITGHFCDMNPSTDWNAAIKEAKQRAGVFLGA